MSAPGRCCQVSDLWLSICQAIPLWDQTRVPLPAWQSILGCAVALQHGRGSLCSLSIPSLIALLFLCLCTFPWRLVPVWALPVVHLQVLPLCLSALGALPITATPQVAVAVEMESAMTSSGAGYGPV